jgi:hypothetical protein
VSRSSGQTGSRRAERRAKVDLGWGYVESDFCGAGARGEEGKESIPADGEPGRLGDEKGTARSSLEPDALGG